MNPIRRIRLKVLGVTQSTLADIVGVGQATVSRWESGTLEPDREHLARIRSEALRRDLPWNDAWFFDRGSRIQPVVEPVEAHP